MNKVIENALNRGAPIDTPICFDIYEFLKLFESEKLKEDYRNSSKETISEISNIIDIYGGEIIIPRFVTLSMDENNSKVLRFSRENLFVSFINLFQGLNDKEMEAIFEDKEKFQILREKIIDIKSPEELKNKFSSIYQLYEEQLKVSSNFIKLEEMLNSKDTPLDLKLRNLSRITNNFKELYSNFNLKRETKFAKDFTLTLFLERLMQAVENMLDNYEEIMDIYYNHTLDINNFNKEDTDKLNLYIAAEFMKQIEKEDANKQRYLFYLTNYFKENVETNVTRVKIKLNSKKITPINLYERYKKLLVNNPDLLAVNFSYNDFKEMTKEEIEEFITAYLSELSANWELIPHNDNSIEKAVRNSTKRKYRNISEEERKQKEEKALNLYMQKKLFFDQTDPYFRIKGKNTFDGYIGHIYSNSLVVLEKFYDNTEKTKLAKDEAIYIISMRDFYELSKLPKPYLYASPLCKRIYHRGNWQKRVLNYINAENSMINPAEYTKKLIEDKKVFLDDKKNL